MIESIHDTKDEAIAAAIAADPSGIVIAHQRDCEIVGADEETCTCVPMTLQLGARA